MKLLLKKYQFNELIRKVIEWIINQSINSMK